MSAIDTYLGNNAKYAMDFSKGNVDPDSFDIGDLWHGAFRKVLAA